VPWLWRRRWWWRWRSSRLCRHDPHRVVCDSSKSLLMHGLHRRERNAPQHERLSFRYHNRDRVDCVIGLRSFLTRLSNFRNSARPSLANCEFFNCRASQPSVSPSASLAISWIASFRFLLQTGNFSIIISRSSGSHSAVRALLINAPKVLKLKSVCARNPSRLSSRSEIMLSISAIASRWYPASSA
jgi:hypothetical protein